MTTVRKYPRPTARRLRIFSFDPALAARYDLAGMSNVTIEMAWEDDLKPGPVGEYIEVVDIDPASGAVYAPIDLNAPDLLATDGLAPSESDPRFHQQMVYAVAMKTIEHFERALGRKALWSSHRGEPAAGKFVENYVPRLRIYPHALRQKNAYYSPTKKALLFGYFPSTAKSGKSVAGTTVFTCLSHDIIAHETTHALLDGVHPRFSEPVNQDVLAFHEAFADIVALFQHFSYPGVLRDQIARTRGDLARESVLGQLAQQFALASGRDDALRSYLGSKDEDGIWRARKPNPTLLEATSEPHDRGAILVAAVFDAFMKVYGVRTRDLFRLASGGTGILREGDIHPDLVNRLAEEAQRCAERALQMCIRALDYCPPVGITFGDYLRAVITADYDMNPSDKENWRLAFIESFREWGISPRGIRSMAEDSLLWPTEEDVSSEQARVEALGTTSGIMSSEVIEDAARRGRDSMTRMFQQPAPMASIGDDDDEPDISFTTETAASARPRDILTPVGLSMGRHAIWLDAKRQARIFHSWLLDESGGWLADVLGLVVNTSGQPMTISARKDTNRARIEIHSVRTAIRRGALGLSEQHIVVAITQWRAGFFDKGKQAEMDAMTGAWSKVRDFKYRAGCTLLMDPEQMSIRRVIRTPGTVADDDELNRMRRYLREGLSPPNAFDGIAERFMANAEPFAFLHSHAGD